MSEEKHNKGFNTWKNLESSTFYITSPGHEPSGAVV